MTQTNPPWTEGAHHVGLTVPDLPAARAFFLDGLGYEVVGEKPDYPAVFVSDGATMVTLWQAEADPVAFDRRQNLGLHHLAIRVAPGRLDDLHARLRSRDDVAIEFAPESLGDGPTRHMMTRGPGGLRLEFIAPAA